jgi:putative transposase
MRKSRFTEEQIVGILQESLAGAKTGDLIRRHGISRETFYNWRRKYGGLKVDEAKPLRAIEDENRRLKVSVRPDHGRLAARLIERWCEPPSDLAGRSCARRRSGTLAADGALCGLPARRWLIKRSTSRS